MSEIWSSITGALADALGAIEGVLEGVFGVHAWGWAIIALTIIVRVLLLPLAIKQTRSMRAMQALQPKIKKIQAKYKTDRDLLKRDPQKYQERKKAMNEEMMALYKEYDVNPASGCLPLLPQIPIFFALFHVLRSPDFGGATKPFYFFTDHITSDATFQGLGAQVNQAGWPGWVLVIGMGVTMFVTQRQMMARNNVEGAQAQQQKILMYVMPVFLAFISQSLPLGVLLYWVTTNLWQGAQQYVILKEVQHHPDGPGADVEAHHRSTGNATPSKRKGADTSRDVKKSSKGTQKPGSSTPTGRTNGASKKGAPDNAGPRSGASDHLPRRKGRSGRNT